MMCWHGICSLSFNEVAMVLLFNVRYSITGIYIGNFKEQLSYIVSSTLN